MRGKVVAAVYIVAVLIVVGASYFWYGVNRTGTTSNQTTAAGGEGIMQCVLAQHIVYQVTYTGSTASYGQSTQITNLLTYLTTTTVTQSLGYMTTFTTTYSTYSGVLALANVTSCEYISG